MHQVPLKSPAGQMVLWHYIACVCKAVVNSPDENVKTQDNNGEKFVYLFC